MNYGAKKNSGVQEYFTRSENAINSSEGVPILLYKEVIVTDTSTKNVSFDCTMENSDLVAGNSSEIVISNIKFDEAITNDYELQVTSADSSSVRVTKGNNNTWTVKNTKKEIDGTESMTVNVTCKLTKVNGLAVDCEVIVPVTIRY